MAGDLIQSQNSMPTDSVNFPEFNEFQRWSRREVVLTLGECQFLKFVQEGQDMQVPISGDKLAHLLINRQVVLLGSHHRESLRYRRPAIFGALLESLDLSFLQKAGDRRH